MTLSFATALPISKQLLNLSLCALFSGHLLIANASNARTADARLPDGSSYYGEKESGLFDGEGRLEWTNGAYYQGGFKDGLFHGTGVWHFGDGGRYEGDFRNGFMHGHGSLYHVDGSEQHGDFVAGIAQGNQQIIYSDGGRYDGEVQAGIPHGDGSLTDAAGLVYKGTFSEGEIIRGAYQGLHGDSYEGEFKDWYFHGKGQFTDPAGNVYRGPFTEGNLTGEGEVELREGGFYEGSLQNWQFHGQGMLLDKDGNKYTGEFAGGMMHGEGEMVYAEPVDGRKTISGTWKWGRPATAEDVEKKRLQRSALEKVLYRQADQLAEATANIAQGEPGVRDVFFVGLAGDGTQAVFRKEIFSVQEGLASRFNIENRSVLLSNDPTSFDSTPLASQTALERVLTEVAKKMDQEEDLLLLYLTSHGSKDHHLSIRLDGVNLPSIAATDLAQVLRDSGIKRKVIIVSACYSGGFIPPLEDSHNLVITAARADRTSFGCSDDSEITYFGRAFFQEALPASSSFEEAFEKARELVHQREAEEQADRDHSEPQIFIGEGMRDFLRDWPLPMDNANETRL